MNKTVTFESKRDIIMTALHNIGVPSSHYSITRHRYSANRLDVKVLFGDKKIELVFYQAWNVDRVERLLRKHINATARQYLRESGVDPDAPDELETHGDVNPALAVASYGASLLR